MANKTSVFTIKLDGADQIVKSAAQARVALEKLRQQQADLVAQLTETPSDSPAYDALKASLAETLQSINAISAALDAGGAAWGDYTASVEDATAATADAAAETGGMVDVMDDLGVSADDVSGISEVFRELGLNISGAGETVGEMEDRLGALNEELRGTKVGSQRFLELNKEIEGTVKKLEAGRKFGEAFALGFKKVGDATNTVEGAKVAITAFEAAYSQATDDVQRAEITKNIFALEQQVIDLQRTAEAGVFPPGSIGRAETELAALTEQLRRLPAGSAEFDKVKKRVDNLQRSVELSNLSLEDQRRLYTDLAVNATATLTGIGSLMNTLGASSKEAEEALLLVAQAQQFIETVRAATDLAFQARRALQLATLKADTAATQENTVAKLGNVAATKAGAGAADVAAKSSKGLVGGIRAVIAALLASPIGLIVTAVVALGAAFVALSKYVKPLGDAFNDLRDSFGGVTGAVKEVVKNGDVLLDFFKEFGEAIGSLVIGPVNAAVDALASLFDPNASAIDTYKQGISGIAAEFEDLADAAGNVGTALADGFKKGFDRSRRLREIEGELTLLDARKQANALTEAALGGAKATESARRANSVALLKEERRLFAERLKLEENISDAEIALVQSGNVAKLKELRKFVDARGDVDEDLIKRVQELTALDTQVLQENEAARVDAIDAQIQRTGDLLTVQQQALGQVQTFSNKQQTIEVERTAALADLQARFQKGDFRSRAEYQRQVLIAEGAFNEKSRALATEQATFVRELNNIDRTATLERLYFERDELEKRGKLTLESELSIVEQTRVLKRQGVEAELDDIDRVDAERVARLEKAQKELTLAEKSGSAERVLIAKTNVEALSQQDETLVKRRRELTIEQANIEREAATARFDAAERNIEREAAARVRLIELAKLELEIARQQQDTQTGGRAAELEAASKELERQKGLAITITDRSRVIRAEAELLTKAYEAQRAQLELTAARRREDLDIQRKELAATRAEIEAAQANKGNFTDPVDVDRLEEIRLKLAQIDAQDVDIQAKLSIDTTALGTDEITKKADNAAQSVRMAFESAGKELGEAVRRGVADSVSRGLLNLFDERNPNATTAERAAAQAEGEAVGKAFAEGAVKTAGALGGQLLELQNVLAENAIAKYEKDVEFFQEQADIAQERLDELTAAAEASAQAQLDLEQQIATARGANADALQTQLDAEADRRGGLQQQIRAQEREKARFERERLAAEAKAEQLRRRQAVLAKSIAVAQAIIAAAGAVVNTYNNPLLLFPANVAAAALVGALGAAQVATIVAQPVEAADGGMLTDAGGVEKMADGGVVRGASHASGGVRGTGRFANVEVEGGEAIIPRDATALNRPLVERLMNEGRRAPLTIFADGGVLDQLGARDHSATVISADAISAARANNPAAGLDELRSEFARAADRKVYVAVTDINEGQQRVDVVDTSAAL